MKGLSASFQIYNREGNNLETRLDVLVILRLIV